MTTNKSTNQTEELLRVLCHDLASPLQILGMCVEVLEDRCPPDLKKILERMKRSTDSMNQIIALTREFHALSSGRKEVKIESVNLLSAIENNIRSLQTTFKEKNISFAYENKSTSDEVYVLAESTSLNNKVLKTILSCAVQNSEPNSSVKIVLKEAGNNVIVNITDHGEGISKELLPHVFTFSKASGLEMPMTKLFLDRYGVELSITSQTREESPTDHGTSFELVFKKAA
jgi:signal transduction histidine kinase